MKTREELIHTATQLMDAADFSDRGNDYKTMLYTRAIAKLLLAGVMPDPTPDADASPAARTVARDYDNPMDIR